MRLIPGDTRPRAPGSVQLRPEDVVDLDLARLQVRATRDPDPVVLALLDRGREDHVRVALSVDAERARARAPAGCVAPDLVDVARRQVVDPQPTTVPASDVRSPARAPTLTGAAPVRSNASRYCDAGRPPLRSKSSPKTSAATAIAAPASAAERPSAIRGRQRRRGGVSTSLASEAIQQALFDGRGKRLLLGRPGHDREVEQRRNPGQLGMRGGARGARFEVLAHAPLRLGVEARRR